MAEQAANTTILFIHMMTLLCLGVEADSGELDGGLNEELVAKLKIRKNSVGQGGKASDNCEGITNLINSFMSVCYTSLPEFFPPFLSI